LYRQSPSPLIDSSAAELRLLSGGQEAKQPEPFCAVLCTTVVHNDIILYYAMGGSTKSFKKYKIQVHNKTHKNRGLRNREQENPTEIYTEKQKSVNSAQVIRLPLQNSTRRPF